MAECARCKTETYLYASGTPICPHCAETTVANNQQQPAQQEIRRILEQDVAEASSRAGAAYADFAANLRAIPSGIPQPDGNRVIHQVSRDLSVARKELMRAHSRLDEFLSRGTIPEDLKILARETR